MKKLFVFYLKNFRVVHHILFIVMAFVSFKLASYIYNPFNAIFQFNPFGTFLQIVILCLCFYFNERALKRAGITDEYMSQQLKNFKQKKEIN